MRLALASLLLVCGSATALAEDGVFTTALGGGAAFTLADQPGVQGLVSLSGRYGLSDRLNLELPVDVALGGAPPALLVGIGLEGVWWQTNHWRFSSGGGLAADYSLTDHVPWTWGPFGQISLRWLAFWGIGFSFDLRVLVPVAQGEVSPAALATPASWQVVLLPALSAYEEY